MAATFINLSAYSDALVVLGTAGVVVPLVRRFGLSPVLGYLGAGAILGPLGLGSFIGQMPILYWLTVVDAKNVSSIAELGVVFLLFLIGLELSFERLLTMRRLVFGLGCLQVDPLHRRHRRHHSRRRQQRAATAAIVGACLVPIVDGDRDRGPVQSAAPDNGGGSRQLFHPAGAGSGRRADPAVRVDPRCAQRRSLLAGLALALAQAALAIGADRRRRPAAAATAVPAGRLRGHQRTVRGGDVVRHRRHGVIAGLAGLSMALGAFVAGLLLAETEFRKAIETTIEPFKGLLLGVFFFTVGMGIDLRELAREPFGCWSLGGRPDRHQGRTHHWPRAAVPRALAGGDRDGRCCWVPGGEFAFVAIGMATTLRLVAADDCELLRWP